MLRTYYAPRFFFRAPLTHYFYFFYCISKREIHQTPNRIEAKANIQIGRSIDDYFTHGNGIWTRPDDAKYSFESVLK